MLTAESIPLVFGHMCFGLLLGVQCDPLGLASWGASRQIPTNSVLLKDTNAGHNVPCISAYMICTFLRPNSAHGIPWRCIPRA